MHALQVFSCYMWLTTVSILDNKIQSTGLNANVLFVPEGDWEESIVMATLLRALLHHQTHSLDNVDPRACISPVSPHMEHTSPILHCRVLCLWSPDLVFDPGKVTLVSEVLSLCQGFFICQDQNRWMQKEKKRKKKRNANELE